MSESPPSKKMKGDEEEMEKKEDEKNNEEEKEENNQDYEDNDDSDFDSMDEDNGLVVDHPNMIRLVVKDLNGMDREGESSPEKIIGGFPWQLNVYRIDDKIYSSIECNQDESLWYHCHLSAIFKLIAHKKYRNSKRKSCVERIGDDEVKGERENCVFGLSLTDLKELEEYSCCFVKDNSITVEAWLEIGCNGKRIDVTLDFLTPTKYSDVILIVGGRKLHVSRQILASRSSYFETLFYGNFKESNQSEIKLEDVRRKDFCRLLSIIHGYSDNLDGRTIESILKLADRFDMPTIRRESEKFLISDQWTKIGRKMELADKYALTFLMDECLVSLDSFSKLRAVKNCDEFRDFSPTVRNDLLTKMTGISNESNNRRSSSP